MINLFHEEYHLSVQIRCYIVLMMLQHLLSIKGIKKNGVPLFFCNVSNDLILHIHQLEYAITFDPGCSGISNLLGSYLYPSNNLVLMKAEQFIFNPKTNEKSLALSSKNLRFLNTVFQANSSNLWHNARLIEMF